ncbi:C40 family peptidase [Kalamiella sp. sgz302252]|uniref:C40 family peptidase n=1 Tax=Pantoea sp. sgz302252 TaxID=3341827 RepID=UPI0036D2A6F4
MRLLITLFMLAFAQLFMSMAHASPHAAVKADHHKADSATPAREDDRRKRRPVKTTTRKVKETSSRKAKEVATKKSRTPKYKLRKKESVAAAALPPKKRYGRHRLRNEETEALTSGSASSPLKLSKAHRARYQKARETAMNKLMSQLGKPYLWGGTSPKTGFDCSGLVWYAYKDLVKFKIPRTANEMYHLRDAASIKRGELEKGDLVFFRINGRGAADHVGVYLGDGKFIQSPRTGKDIQVSALSEDYWEQHYVGARRVMTPKTIR